MKQPKKPTRDQKAMLVREGLNPKEWMVQMEGSATVSFIHKETRKTQVLLR